MKFFTREWANGTLEEGESRRLERSYDLHLTSIMPKLPRDAQLLASEISIHDGLIKNIKVDRSTRTISLELICGDIQKGYFDLDILYRDAKLIEMDINTLETLTKDQRTELLYDEFEQLDNSKFIHRILLEPEGELAFSFDDLRIYTKPRKNRNL